MRGGCKVHTFYIRTPPINKHHIRCTHTFNNFCKSWKGSQGCPNVLRWVTNLVHDLQEAAAATVIMTCRIADDGDRSSARDMAKRRVTRTNTMIESSGFTIQKTTVTNKQQLTTKHISYNRTCSRRDAKSTT